VFFQTVKIALNGIPNICDGFIASLALRNASRKHWAFHHKYTVFVWLDHHSKLHVGTLAAGGVYRNAETISSSGRGPNGMVVLVKTIAVTAGSETALEPFPEAEILCARVVTT
jgi:hypothetical protein